MMCLTLGEVRLQLDVGPTRTTFPDGTEVCARHDDVAQLGQHATALALGYPDVQAMNRAHDVLHSLLALWLRLPVSPTLSAVAHGQACPVWREEEAVILALQRLCVMLDIDVVALAQTYSDAARCQAPPDCRCGHPAAEHVSGLCLSTLDCLCRGFQASGAGCCAGAQEPVDGPAQPEWQSAQS